MPWKKIESFLVLFGLGHAMVVTLKSSHPVAIAWAAFSIQSGSGVVGTAITWNWEKYTNRYFIVIRIENIWIEYYRRNKSKNDNKKNEKFHFEFD